MVSEIDDVIFPGHDILIAVYSCTFPGSYSSLRLALGQRQSEGENEDYDENDEEGIGAPPPPPPPPEDPASTTTTSSASTQGSAREHIVPADSSDQYIGISDSADPAQEGAAGQGKHSLESYLESTQGKVSR
jgi:hypothetical protein